MTSRLGRRELLKRGVALSAAGLTGTGESQTVHAKPAARYPERIRVAIIGVEGHYSEVLDATEVVPQIHITAIAEKSEALLTRARRNPLLAKARTYQDYRSLLDREELDVAVVCGENGTRAQIVRDCAAHKLPIVAEKPLALSLGDLETIRAAVAASPAPITMLLPMRFHPPYRKMRSLIQEGAIGEVVSMAAQKSYKLGERSGWMKARKTYGGTIPYIGIHMVDLMIFVAGRRFEEVAAFHSNVGFPVVGEMENNAVVIFRLDNRGTASLRLDYLRPGTAPTHGDDRLRIAGTKGVIEYQGSSLTIVTSAQRSAEVSELPLARLLFVDFLEALYGGGRHILSQEEIFRVNEVVLKAREAADSGRVISL
jgi:predicted dehydrogenase